MIGAHSPTHSQSSSADRGFTLIEILVVIMAIAILSSYAILNLNIGGYDDQLRDEARRLFQLTRIASDDAIFKTTQYGIRFTQHEYTFYSLQDADQTTATSDNKKSRRWLAIDEQLLRARELPEEIEIEVFIEGLPIVLDDVRDAKAESVQETLRPHLMFLSNGETMPNVEVHLSSSESDKTWRIGRGEEGLLALDQLGEL